MDITKSNERSGNIFIHLGGLFDKESVEQFAENQFIGIIEYI